MVDFERLKGASASLTHDEIIESTQLVIDTFKEFRDELMESYGNTAHISKQDNSPVTELDIKVETTLRQRLEKTYPHIGFHGEETAARDGTVDALWIVDPIDGTSSFVHGLPYCTNMAALIVDGETVAAVIYQFPTDDLYTAFKNEGAYKNNIRISVKNTPLSDSIVFSGSFVYKNLYHIFQPHSIGVYAPVGASGYEFSRLAEGSIQAVTKLRCKSQIHDDAPGVLIAREAGAQIMSFEEGEYSYKTLSFVIGTPNIMEIVRESRKNIERIITQ